MRLLKYLNPVFAYQRRALIGPYLRSYARDVGLFAAERGNRCRARLAEHGLPLSTNDRRFAALRDKHKGQRCFIIGNGPSLRIADLERLSSEITFASNRIYVAFGETNWRPTYYATAYLGIHDHYYEDIDRIERSVKFLPTSAAKQCSLVRNAIYFRHVHEWFYPGHPCFSCNALEKVYWGATITYMVIQLAYYMGIREMYLMGVDFDYRVPSGQERAPGEAFVVGEDRGHFHPGYLKPGEINYFPTLEWHGKAYEAARAALEKAGGCIYNATRGGKLEVFPRVDFDQIVPPAPTS